AVLLAGGVFLAAGGCQRVPATVQAGGGSLSHGRRPIIGITSAYIPDGDYAKVNSSYAQAVREAGGTPVILPVIQDDGNDRDLVGEYVRILDGLLLTGGDDVPPEAYGEKPLPQTRTLSGRRHRFEKAIIEAWLETRKPILGVCRGLQEVNVVCGGSLVQDIPTQVGTSVIHRKPKASGTATHMVEIEPGTKLRSLFSGASVRVNSNHHQAVRDVGRNLRVAARSPDGVIEALELTDGRFGLLVQWHPESIKDAEHRQAVYGAFVRACGAGGAMTCQPSTTGRRPVVAPPGQARR
ncbi:MAG: gamma-glutamyl-gamma-aminobutyrate hydrolase family protein, partial [Phycisphaerae bacterium]